MEFYTIIIYILRRFQGFVFISIIHGILMVIGGGPQQNCGIGAKEVGETGGPPPPTYVAKCAIVVVVYVV